MNASTPDNPNEKQSDHEQAPDRTVDIPPNSLRGNPYVAPQEQPSSPDLNAGAPSLPQADVRRMNRRAIGFLAGIVVLLLTSTVFLLSGVNSSKPEPKHKNDETVAVPAAPVVNSILERTSPPDPIPIVSSAPPAAMAEPSQASRPTVSRGPSLMERRMADANTPQTIAAIGKASSESGLGGQPSVDVIAGSPNSGLPGSDALVNTAYRAKALAEISKASPLPHPDSLMLRGTFIRCVLETRIVTDMPGFTSCIVTEPTYSFTGKHLLLPKGSKVMGKYEMEPNGPRVAVIWDRIVTPTGIDVSMASPGVDTLGGAGHPGHYSAHWGSRIGAALLISLLSDAFKYEGEKHGPKQTTISNGVVTENPFESNTAATVQKIADSAVRRAANRPATVTVNQGTVLAIYVAKDVDFSGVMARY